MSKIAVTIRDVAKKAGVSRACVSKYLNNIPYVSEKTKRKIENATKVLNYTPTMLMFAGLSLLGLLSGILLKWEDGRKKFGVELPLNKK